MENSGQAVLADKRIQVKVKVREGPDACTLWRGG